MQICERHRRYRDYTRDELRLALREAAACLPVYRTYVQAKTGLVHAQDAHYIEAAIAAAKTYRPELDPNLFDFLRDLLLLRIPGELESEFVMRFQQFTGPVMAKGVEDTAFYNYYRLVSLNEVGGSPGQFGLSVAAFHAGCEAAQPRYSRSLLAGTTHDTKRSEDVRARLNLLSEIPGEWQEAVRRWAVQNEKHRRGDAPDRNDEYLIYQTLAGAWPISGERLDRYLEKAMREAKSHSSWTDPDPDYEAGVLAFAAAIMNDPEFRRELETFAGRLVEPGRINSLAQTLLRLTCPGVPDIYQGAELWTDSLVDPDNRRPVDYEKRRRLIAQLSDGLAPEAILAEMGSGLPKLWLIHQALLLRRQRPDCFGPSGGYSRLAASSDHALAFMRGESVAVVAPRLVMRRAETWPGTVISLPSGAWRNVLTGEQIAGGDQPLDRLLRRFPVALLSRDEG
jgi:(1->4)-alpha-D-glucan 1-alpha-D-glucosylmutase